MPKDTNGAHLLTFSDADIALVKGAIEANLAALYSDASVYRRSGKTECVKDCFNEARKLRELQDRINASLL